MYWAFGAVPVTKKKVLMKFISFEKLCIVLSQPKVDFFESLAFCLLLFKNTKVCPKKLKGKKNLSQRPCSVASGVVGRTFYW